MHRKLRIILSVFIVLTSCTKDEVPGPYVQYNSSDYTGMYFAYFKGTVTDSITGTPITGYDICHKYVFPFWECDTLADGTYQLSTYGLLGKMPVSFPPTVYVDIKNAADSIVKTVSFPGAQLIYEDTIVVDFQVNL